MDQLYVSQQLYSYPGQYLISQPTLDRIAETILKLEEDVLQLGRYPTPRYAKVIFGEPIDVLQVLEDRKLNARNGVRAMTGLIRGQIEKLSPAGSQSSPVGEGNKVD